MADGSKEEAAAAVTAATEAQSNDVSVEPSEGPAKVHVTALQCLAWENVGHIIAEYIRVPQLQAVDAAPQPPPLRSGWSQIVKGKLAAAEAAAEAEKAETSGKPAKEHKQERKRDTAKAANTKSADSTSGTHRKSSSEKAHKQQQASEPASAEPAKEAPSTTEKQADASSSSTAQAETPAADQPAEDASAAKVMSSAMTPEPHGLADDTTSALMCAGGS